MDSLPPQRTMAYLQREAPNFSRLTEESSKKKHWLSPFFVPLLPLLRQQVWIRRLACCHRAEGALLWSAPCWLTWFFLPTTVLETVNDPSRFLFLFQFVVQDICLPLCMGGDLQVLEKKPALSPLPPHGCLTFSSEQTGPIHCTNGKWTP